MLNLEQAKHLSNHTGNNVLPGEIRCASCKKHLLDLSSPEYDHELLETGAEDCDDDINEPPNTSRIN